MAVADVVSRRQHLRFTLGQTLIRSIAGIEAPVAIGTKRQTGNHTLQLVSRGGIAIYIARAHGTTDGAVLINKQSFCERRLRSVVGARHRDRHLASYRRFLGGIPNLNRPEGEHFCIGFALGKINKIGVVGIQGVIPSGRAVHSERAVVALFRP